MSSKTDEVTRLPASPREDPSSSEGSPLADPLPLIERGQLGGPLRAILGAGVLRVPRSWGTPSKCCNKPPILFEAEQERFDKILSSVKEGDLYSVKVVLNSKSFFRSFGLNYKLMAYSGEDNAENKLVGNAAQVVGDEGESHHSRDEHPRGDHSRDGSIEYIAMSKGQICRSSPKWKKEVGPSVPPRWLSDIEQNGEQGLMLVVAPEEGTLANLGDVLGFNTSMLQNPAMAEKLLKGVIPPFDKEEVVVLASSLARRGRELKEGAMTQQARANLVGTEILQAQ
ncbi:hypothetical protein Acr_24g0006820 [Actinidia rufa]|uniref:Uncharacterized protein n=1 Tax=Actinidia rufa TaxID=165716 RepID=A0A7J0GUM1_9ERIC|nr:hypothetical protein Acr_24g0006820 [Actinidia rufa]